MLDINLIREQPDIVRKNLEKRADVQKRGWVDKILDLDLEWKNLKVQVDELRAHRNVLSRKINETKKNKENAANLIRQAKELPEMIADKERRMQEIKGDVDSMLMRLPNILHESVPVGDGEGGNVVEKEAGKKPKFPFVPKSHVDLLEGLGGADIGRAAKISGARFWFLRGKLAELDLALQKYAVDFMVQKGYTLSHPPYMMNRAAYEGVTDLGDFETVMYKIENEDLYLIATSEHPLTAQFQNEILSPEELPIRIVGISACFRKEAGSHGKDTKGIFRGHQFHKVEQVVICHPGQSWDLHEEMIKNAEEFWISLGIPFRRMNICTGDIGSIAAKKYDLEAWMPAQKAYREVVSCSNCTDYQARRLRIRMRVGEMEKIVPHTLNSTCVATSRALVAILENFQNKDGSVSVPKVLQPYMNGLKKIETATPPKPSK